MSELEETLQTAFEQAGYDVAEVNTNRDKVRAVLREEGAEGSQLRAVVHETLGEDDVMGLDVTSESVEGEDFVRTVVTFRDRS